MTNEVLIDSSSNSNSIQHNCTIGLKINAGNFENSADEHFENFKDIEMGLSLRSWKRVIQNKGNFGTKNSSSFIATIF